MILPKGEARHENLLTAYTDVSALLNALKSEGFSGTVEIEFPEREGTIFIDSGELLNAEIKERSNAERKIGQEAIQVSFDFIESKERGRQCLPIATRTCSSRHQPPSTRSSF